MSKRPPQNSTRPQAGYESAPQGRLLKQLLDLDKPMGLAYERSVGFYKPPHTHSRHLIVCPRGGSEMEVRVRAADGTTETHRVNSSQVLWVPHTLEHDDESLSVIYDTLALFPSQEYVAQAVTENGLTPEDAETLRTRCIKLKRTRWLDDIIDRYFFERVVSASSPVGCTFFLEKQIMNELMRIIFRDRFASYGRAIDQEEDSLALKALQYIETNLFEPLSVDQIARHFKTSASSLLRHFRSEFALNPYQYIKSRRLEEARQLIEKGEYQVGDVAVLVGYEDFTAFSKAFRAKYGKPPSAFLPSKPRGAKN